MTAFADTEVAPSMCRLALEHARLYRRLGYNVLPSRCDAKRPMVRFAHLWEELAPEKWFTDEGWFLTPSLQIMTGRFWRLAVIDLDGPEAIEEWSMIGRGMFYPRTWESTSGGGGRHVWFGLPEDLPCPLPKRVLWGGVEKHKAIEFLCDRSLVMAPPSIHPRTGRFYQFRAGHSPRELPRPAMIPRWVLELATSRPDPSVGPVVSYPEPLHMGYGGPVRDCVDRRDVLTAIHDKTALVRSWGLRIASGQASQSGWISCHDFNREDVHPSARFHPLWGRFWRPNERTISLFDLGVALGHYSDWRECCADLARMYLPVPRRRGHNAASG